MAKRKGKGDGDSMENGSANGPHGGGGGKVGGGEPGKPKCGAKKRQFPYTPCEQPAGFGTEHPGYGLCKFHGGSSPGGIIAARRERIDTLANIELNRQALVPVENPLVELQLLAAEVVRWKNILGSQIETLESWTTESLMESEEIRATIAAYERGLDRTNTVLSGMVRLNLEERQQKLSAAWGALMVELLEAVFGAKELGLNRKQLQTVKAVVARELPRFAVTAA